MNHKTPLNRQVTRERKTVGHFEEGKKNKRFHCSVQLFKDLFVHLINIFQIVEYSNHLMNEPTTESIRKSFYPSENNLKVFTSFSFKSPEVFIGSKYTLRHSARDET